MCVHYWYLCIWFDQKTTMKKNNLFDKLATQELYRLIVKGDSLSDEAVDYLIRMRLRALLKDVYAVYENRCRDGYEDALSEFFLYLREGAHADNNVPYEAMLGLQHPEALASWMQSTFRNYLNNRVASEVKTMELLADYPEDVEDSNSCDVLVDTERKIETFAHLVAYMLHVLQPRERFILLRWLLTILDKSKALPEKDIAQAMGLSYEAYRVIVYRVKMQTRHNLSVLMEEGSVILQNSRDDANMTHSDCLPVAADINDHFADLYNCLIAYYEGTLSVLPNAEVINQLRLARQEERGSMVHDASTIEYRKSKVAVIRSIYRQVMLDNIVNSWTD